MNRRLCRDGGGGGKDRISCTELDGERWVIHEASPCSNLHCFDTMVKFKKAIELVYSPDVPAKCLDWRDQGFSYFIFFLPSFSFC